MEKINDMEFLSSMPDRDFILITRLANPDHVQKDDKIHEKGCRTLKILMRHMRTMPKNKNYYRIRPSDKKTVRSYAGNRCSKCLGRG